MRNTSARTGNEYALVTGGSSGIGCELAKVFAQNGFNLILVARNLDRLETVAHELARDYKTDCQVISADLSVMSDVEKVHSRVRTGNLSVSVLVNDAGIGKYGPFIEADFQEEHEMVNLNMLGLTFLTKLFAKDMVAKGSGRILNVASVVGFWPVPSMAVYAATKAYVISFSVALASELKGTGVLVSVLCPPAVDTNFLKDGQQRVIERSSGALAATIARMRHMDAETVARVAYRDLMKNRRLIVPSTPLLRVIRVSMKLLPQELVCDVRARSQRKKPFEAQ